MIRTYQKGHSAISKSETLPQVLELQDLIWIDIQNSTLEEIDSIEKIYNVNIPSRLQQEEIESSSRYIETDYGIVANSTFLQCKEDNSYERIHVSFVIKDDLLITYRENQLRSFSEVNKKIKTNNKPYFNGKKILIGLFETRIDFDADLVENIAHQIYFIGKALIEDNGAHPDLLKKITTFQEITMQIRENIIDKQRVVSSMLKNPEFQPEDKISLEIILRDIVSLIEHTNFIFERLEYFQNTFLGLINIEQNKIIKIFTVASVVFMPPTLIASIYGMNLKNIPESNWSFGYPFALIMMVFSAFLTWFIFKKLRWV